MRGNDSWIGRSIKKNCGSARRQKWFTGRVDGVDDHADHKGHRLFHVTYSDGDDEWMEVDELQDIMLPPGAPSVSLIRHVFMKLRAIYNSFCFS